MLQHTYNSIKRSLVLLFLFVQSQNDDETTKESNEINEKIDTVPVKVFFDVC